MRSPARADDVRRPRAAATLAPALPPDPPRILVRTWLLAVGGLGLAKVVSYLDPDRDPRREPRRGRGVPVHRAARRTAPCAPRAWGAYGARPGPCATPGRGGRLGAGPGRACSSARSCSRCSGRRSGPTRRCSRACPGALARVSRRTRAPRASRSGCRTGASCSCSSSSSWWPLPEELFYRGWMQTALGARATPARGVTVLGARLGAGFVWTQAALRGRPPRGAPAVAARRRSSPACSSAGSASAPAGSSPRSWSTRSRTCSSRRSRRASTGDRPAAPGARRAGHGRARIREMLEELEERTLHPRAARAARTRGRERPEPDDDERPSFQRDRDRLAPLQVVPPAGRQDAGVPRAARAITTARASPTRSRSRRSRARSPARSA